MDHLPTAASGASSSNRRHAPAHAVLSALPTEILLLVLSHLTHRELVSLRKTGDRRLATLSLDQVVWRRLFWLDFVLPEWESTRRYEDVDAAEDQREHRDRRGKRRATGIGGGDGGRRLPTAYGIVELLARHQGSSRWRSTQTDKGEHGSRCLPQGWSGVASSQRPIASLPARYHLATARRTTTVELESVLGSMDAPTLSRSIPAGDVSAVDHVDWESVYRVCSNWKNGFFSVEKLDGPPLPVRSRRTSSLSRSKTPKAAKLDNVSADRARRDPNNRPMTLVQSTSEAILTISRERTRRSASQEGSRWPVLHVYPSETHGSAVETCQPPHPQRVDTLPSRPLFSVDLADTDLAARKQEGDESGVAVTEMRIDASASASLHKIRVFLAFDHGDFMLIDLDLNTRSWTQVELHHRDDALRRKHGKDPIVQAGLNGPLLVTCTQDFAITIYRLHEYRRREAEEAARGGVRVELEVVEVLKSYISRWPASMQLSQVNPPAACESSIGVARPELFVLSVAYSTPSYPSGWTIGVQELAVLVDREASERRSARIVSNRHGSATHRAGKAERSTPLDPRGRERFKRQERPPTRPQKGKGRRRKEGEEPESSSSSGGASAEEGDASDIRRLDWRSYRGRGLFEVSGTSSSSATGSPALWDLTSPSQHANHVRAGATPLLSPPSTPESDEQGSASENRILSLALDMPFIVAGADDNVLEVYRVDNGFDRALARGELELRCRAQPSSIEKMDPTFWDWEVAPSSADEVPVSQSYGLRSPRLQLDHIRTLYGHTAAVRSVAALEGRCASGSSDGTVMLWRLIGGGGGAEDERRATATDRSRWDGTAEEMGHVLTLRTPVDSDEERNRPHPPNQASSNSHSWVARYTALAKRDIVSWVDTAFDKILSVSVDVGARVAESSRSEEVQIWSFSR